MQYAQWVAPMVSQMEITNWPGSTVRLLSQRPQFESVVWTWHGDQTSFDFAGHSSTLYFFNCYFNASFD